jgi:hypothetical protein
MQDQSRKRILVAVSSNRSDLFTNDHIVSAYNMIVKTKNLQLDIVSTRGGKVPLYNSSGSNSEVNHLLANTLSSETVYERILSHKNSQKGRLLHRQLHNSVLGTHSYLTRSAPSGELYYQAIIYLGGPESTDEFYSDEALRKVCIVVNDIVLLLLTLYIRLHYQSIRTMDM